MLWLFKLVRPCRGPLKHYYTEPCTPFKWIHGVWLAHAHWLLSPTTCRSLLSQVNRKMHLFVTAVIPREDWKLHLSLTFHLTGRCFGLSVEQRINYCSSFTKFYFQYNSNALMYFRSDCIWHLKEDCGGRHSPFLFHYMPYIPSTVNESVDP